MDLEIQGHSALVSASSSGLGKASATALAEEGANVVINGRDQERLEATAEEIRETATGEVVAHAADLTDESEIRGLVDRAVEEFGGLDHLVTNAGGPPSGPFSGTTDEDWYQAFDLLVMSSVRLVRNATEHLQAGDGGTIVNITSHSVKEALDELVLSNSVRMSVVGLEKTLARELAPDVRVNAIMPGPHKTNRMEYLIQNSVDLGEHESYEESYDEWTEDIPFGEMGDPYRFGQTVAYLSGAPSEFVSGTTVMVDGGQSRSTL